MAKPKKTTSNTKAQTPVQPTLTPGLRVVYFNTKGNGPFVGCVSRTSGEWVIIKSTDAGDGSRIDTANIGRVLVFPEGAPADSSFFANSQPNAHLLPAGWTLQTLDRLSDDEHDEIDYLIDHADNTLIIRSGTKFSIDELLKFARLNEPEPAATFGGRLANY